MSNERQRSWVDIVYYLLPVAWVSLLWKGGYEYARYQAHPTGDVLFLVFFYGAMSIIGTFGVCMAWRSYGWWEGYRNGEGWGKYQQAIEDEIRHRAERES